MAWELIIQGAGRVTHGIHTSSYRNGPSRRNRRRAGLCGDGQHRHDGDRDRGRQEAQSAPRSEQAVPRAVAPQAYRDRRETWLCRATTYSRAQRIDNVSGQPQQDVSSTTPIHALTTRRADTPRTVIVPRVIRPRIVTVVPYRPYVYHPSFSIGVFYGAGGAVSVRLHAPRLLRPAAREAYYGGLRITGAPRDAQVFADGYYVGIVNDFDGVFQHVNLEAGPHHIEIQEPGSGADCVRRRRAARTDDHVSRRYLSASKRDRSGPIRGRLRRSVSRIVGFRNARTVDRPRARFVSGALRVRTPLRATPSAILRYPSSR